MAKKRWFPKKPNPLKGTPYDSLLEKRLHDTLLKGTRFHDKQDKVAYTVPHTYEPDFVLQTESKKYLIETKGRFRDSTEARKYLFIREVLPEDVELVFVFEKALTPMPFARKRKDGTKRTHADWATEKGFRWWDQTQFNMEKLLETEQPSSEE